MQTAEARLYDVVLVKQMMLLMTTMPSVTSNVTSNVTLSVTLNVTLNATLHCHLDYNHLPRSLRPLHVF